MRQQNAGPMIRTIAIAAGVFLLALPMEADAERLVRGEWAQSKAPVYKVGDYNAKLSALCRKGLFRQRKLLRLSIGFVGPDGYGITGIAQQGYNLYDPTGASEPQRTYHFFSQGYSNCRVYVAVTPPPPPRQ